VPLSHPATGCEWKRKAQLQADHWAEQSSTWRVIKTGESVLESLVQVALPEMGESVTEGSIVEWRTNVGQWVDEGETLVDVTTDKVDVEVPSTVAGLVVALHGSEGSTVAVGTVLAEIDPTATKPAGAPAEIVAAPTPALSASAPGSGERRAPQNGALRGVASHRAQLIAQRYHLDLSAVTGTGPAGLILREDVDRALAAGDGLPVPNGKPQWAPSPVAFPALPPRTIVTELKGAVGTLASYMDASLTIPTATSFRTLGVGALESRRATLNAALKAAGRSEKISFTHLIAYAIVQAAKEQPAMTAAFRRENGKPQRIEAGIHLGLAVDSQRKDGSRFLVVPVIKSADALDFVAFRATYEELVAKTREGKLSVDEQTGASFTLTNPGGIGTVASVPRLMVGQGAIIAAGSIAPPPGFARAPEATLTQLGIEKVMTLTSTYDHRVIQGAQSGEFLRRIDQLLGGADGFYESIFAQFGVTAAPVEQKAAAVASAAAGPATGPTTLGASDEMVRAIAAGMAMVSSYRRHGHLAATLDPLGVKPQGDPSLSARSYNLTPALLSAVPASVLRVKVPGNTLADVLPRLRETYASTIAYEIEHISNTAQREWLREYIESGLHRRELTAQRKVQVLQRLTKVETMERYFRKQFLSQKTFSIEGLDMMVPMLEEIISMLAEDGTQIAVLGMAHRGRLSTIAHVVNRPYEELLAEFEAGAMKAAVPEPDDEDDVTGDVKYHHGADGVYTTSAGTEIKVKLANNPSHLEAVDGVVEGITRALQTDHVANPPVLDFTTAAPILIHGDAAFAAQGVVAEVLNLQALTGYSTGGTIHIISNNQIGFTTDPQEGRSTRYSSDLAKGYDVPIVHVNADAVEACIAAVRLAIDYRAKFGRDTVIDLIGYRRFGHNEQDEPMYTQPLMYDAIKSHPTVRELFAAQLVAQGVITTDEVKAMQDAASARIAEAHRNVRDGNQKKLIGQTKPANGHIDIAPNTGVDRARLLRYADEIVAIPADFQINKKLDAQFAKRRTSLLADGEVDWGLAEALAFASLLGDGTPIRLTGQDVERGTFSHRHAVLHDMRTNQKFVPLQHTADAQASFEIYNSPLSEYACLGFEYGYGGVLPNALVLWEAQFGDFNNGAQIIIDQFIAAGAAKWGQETRLTLLLPHGYEGAGPEHSSARLERFLQLSAEGNIRVANCSTSSQYFHLLRSQAKTSHAYPLVVMTPKSLLRNRSAYGSIDELTSGEFRPVISDARFADRAAAVERLLLCTGKIYHDLVANPAYARMRTTAVARVEMLSPLPKAELLALIASYPNLKRIIWVQEEPKNMGARAHVRRRLMDDLPQYIGDIDYIGRPYRASPSEGYPGAHAVEQERIVRAALVED
jgi:2-oxoglutarate decarboxylase